MNKRTSRSKTRLLSLSGAVLLLALAGCSGSNEPLQGASPSPLPSVSPSPSAAPSPSPSPPAPSASPSEEPAPSAAPSEPEAKKGEGKFSGLADSHTIEIEMDGRHESFQLGEGTAEAAFELEPGDLVSFEYTEQPVEGDPQAKQLMLTSLAKAEPPAS
ncbi:hypothetical protein NYE40_04560 [Paenibacillus sp. FSL W8-1187]|uniref:hypothetical protein n=1 Tax=unclassified Paenibacillus TaxID=185978 RepID=UPI001891DFE9|nr:hypothetical protein [Paenibacillus sp. B01]